MRLKNEKILIKSKLINYEFVIFFILNAIRNILLFFSLNSIATLFFYGVYTVVFLMIATIFLNMNHIILVKVDAYVTSAILLLLFLLVIPVFYDASIWSFNSYSHLSFFMTVILLVFSYTVVLSEKTIKYCLYSFFIQGLFAIFLSFLPSSYENGSLVLNLGNPNQTAIVLWTIFSFMFLSIVRNEKTKVYKIINVIVLISILVLIVLTNSRTAILSCGITILFYFLFRRKNTNIIKYKLLQNCLIVSPIIFFAIILLLSSFVDETLTIMGKELLSGRETIWKSVLNSFLVNPFNTHLDLSPQYSYVNINGVDTLKSWGVHNGIIAIQWNYGILVCLLFLCILFINFHSSRNSALSNKSSMFVFIVCLSCMLYISFEDAFILGNLCTTFVIPFLFIIGNSFSYNDNSKRKLL